MRRFIYLDTDTLNSYIAQIYDGLVQTQETETQSSQATDKQSERTSNLGADADLKVFGKGIIRILMSFRRYIRSNMI